MNNKNKLFLYAGLSLLLITIIIRGFGVSSAIWIPIFSIAILLKGIFLINIFRSKKFKMTGWLMFILIGVAMILISMLFKSIFPIPLIRDVLFYGAITFKVLGLILMLVQKIK